ncbi:adenylate cyclase [Haemophilus paracuniculus]|uniref:Adenylate cyclase n=1 Tax=Haemophilus paracuniculus TaxID=734 RepID=A0A1T0ARD1_9PAST|nr:CYTH domain-containing protein [Haemophilus paracuniculus]OOR98719.1 adenylate cyclase [Haemophilus paracuniculus]
MENEIELKLMLKEQAIPALLAWINQQNILTQSSETLGNCYYDTPTQFFAAQQMGFRVRQKNSEYEQTLKTKGEIVGGLHIRPEYNLPLSNEKPDFKGLVSHYSLNFEPKAVEQIQQNLIATFSTDFHRTKWLIKYQQSQIEIALDQGLIKNQYGEENICEMEFELKSGELKAILNLLTTLPNQDGVWFSSLSKAQRGYLVGRADKYQQEMERNLAQHQGFQLEQELADYIRTVDAKGEILENFYIFEPSLKNKDHTDLIDYLISNHYFQKTLKQIIALYA